MPDRTDDIPDKFLECRTLQHAWRATDVTIDGRVYIQHLRCMHGCGTVRHVRIDRRTGRIKGASYTYPDGYALTGGYLSADERGSLRLRTVT